MKRFLLGLGLILCIASNNIWAQDGNNTLYFLPNSPQKIKVNPAYQPEYRTAIGIPGLNGAFVNYYNNSLKVNDVLRWGEGEKSDSVVVDADKLHKALRKKNSISVNTEIPFLFVSFGRNKWHASFEINQRNDIGFTFNKQLISFIKNGNADYLNKRVNLGGLDVKGSAYNEIALGFSRKVDENEKWTAGGRVKLLFGIANVHTKNSSLKVRTSAIGDTLLVASTQDIKVSAPLRYETEDGFLEWESLEFDDDRMNGKFFSGTGNIGFGLDLGVTYKFSDKITLEGSILDLGFISWKENTYNFTQNTEFAWTGVDLSSTINKDDPEYKSFEDAFDDLVDSLKNDFRLTDGQQKYTTALNAKLNFGGTYEINEKINVGGLVRGTFMGKRFFPTLTLSGNFRPHRNFGASVTYSVINGDFVNIGAGITAKLGCIQMFLVTDNLLAMNYTNTRTTSVRVGFNLLFRNKKLWEDRQRGRIETTTTRL